MNHSPKSTRSLSSESSTDSIVSSALKTPIDVQEEMAALVDPSFPLPGKFRSHPHSGQMMSNVLASRLESLPKRATTVPTAIASSSCSIKSKTLDPRSPPSTTNSTTNATSTRLGRLRSESISSMASNGSQSSALLRATLLMASPSLRNSYHHHHHSDSQHSRARSHSESQSKSNPQPHSRAQSVGHQLPQQQTQLYMRSILNTSRNRKNNINVIGKESHPPASGSGPTSSLLTPRTSISSFASTSLSSPNSQSSRNDSTRRGSHSSSVDRKSIKSNLSTGSRNLSTELVGALVAAEATTAVSTQTSSSLAQFAPTSGAKTSLLQFGVQRHERASTSVEGSLSISTGRHNVVVTHFAQPVDARRSRSRGNGGRQRLSSASSPTGLVHERQEQEVDEQRPQFGLRYVTGWFGKQRDLPSISRGLEPDTNMDDSAFGGIQVIRRHHLRSATESMASSIAGKRESGLGFTSGHLQTGSNAVEEGALAATPRPSFPIDSHTPKQHSQLQSKQKEVQQVDAPRISALDKGKGRARPLSPMLTRHASSPPGDSRLRPDPASLLSVPKPASPPSKRNGGDLPTLAAIESGSRLMRQKIVCATCGETGPDFPRCGRCGEAWCSRDCRSEANKATGGKHRCCASVA